MVGVHREANRYKSKDPTWGETPKGSSEGLGDKMSNVNIKKQRVGVTFA